MVVARRVITLSIDPDQCRALANIARSRSEATGRVERARIILAYLDTPSAYGVARLIGVSQQTVMRCLATRPVASVRERAILANAQH